MKTSLTLLVAGLLLDQGAATTASSSSSSVVVETTKAITIGTEKDNSNANVRQEGGEKEQTCTLKNDSTGECMNPDASVTNQSDSTTSSGGATGIPGLCLDDREECPDYAVAGHCETNPKYMLAHCKASCNACPADFQIFDNHWGEPQECYGDNADKIKQIVKDTEVYMTTKVYKQSLYLSVREICLNRDKLCSKWAAEGECQNNPMWMTTNCGPACQTCEKMDHRIRCPFDDRAPKVWVPGSLDEMFETIITEPYYQQYQPRVLSRPPDELTKWVPAVHNSKLEPGDKPWVIELETFLTTEECDRLIELGGQQGYKQSYEVGGKNPDGTYSPHDSQDRTSYNAWCFEKSCYEDPITQRILKKVENVTGIPEKNSEFFQLLKYEVGGLYRQHNDYVPGDFERAQGVRILTVFIYLNDMDEDAGGETAFPKLDLKIRPKKGKAVLWPNVYMRNPDAQDPRLLHEARPVKKGQKYAANLWIHQRDFKTPFFQMCN